MKKTNWENVNKAAKAVKKNYKNMSKTIDLLKDFPPKGYMSDYKKVEVGVDESGKPIKEKQIVQISIYELKAPALRRLISFLNNSYYLIDSEKQKKMILDKKIELETELAKRPANE